MTELVGQVLADRYRVIRPIASGGMGVLFEVENTRIGRRFALKTLSSATAARPDSLARFRREAEIVARLHHPNIVAIVDWDALPGGAPFYVMELLEGEDLAARIGRGTVPWPELAAVASQAMSALAEAHRHGVLHRDLKPANVFLCRVGGDSVHVKVLDFGLARARGNVAITNYDKPQWIGTPQYMSPEQIRGESEPGEKADVWGMSAVLYELATGKPAFSGAIDQLIKDIGNRRPVPVRVLREDAPEEFADAIESALSPSRERRITTIDELAARVRAALGVVSESTPVPPPLRKKKPSRPPEVSASDTAADLPSSRRRRERVVRRAWVKGALVGGVIAAVGVAAMFAVWGMSGDDDDERQAVSFDAAAIPKAIAPPLPPPGPVPAPTPVEVVATPDAAPVPEKRPRESAPETSAASEDPEKAKAKEHFRAGTTAFNLGDFQKAIAEFSEAYEIGHDPRMLFNIAQAHRENHNCQDAAFFYRRYLAMLPDAKNRAKVERAMAECGRVNPF